jgi:hypothetical protein
VLVSGAHRLCIGARRVRIRPRRLCGDLRALRIATGLSVLLLPSAVALQKPLEIPPLYSGEGALENDSFLPGATGPTQKISEGDRAFAKAHAAASIGDNAYDEALDRWHEALTTSALDDAVVADADSTSTLGALRPDPDRSSARRAESIECAVSRRLVALDPRLLGLWRARSEGLAANELESAGSDPGQLGRIAHDHPLTQAAARACLQLCDIHFESGETLLARAWLERASRSAAAGTPLAAGIARRSAALSAYESTAARTSSKESWEDARRLRLLTRVALSDEASRDAGARDRRPRPGIAWMSDDTIVVQSADMLHVCSASGALKHIDLASSAALLTLTFSPTFSDPLTDLAAWPASDGEHMIVVAGRSLGSRGNALLAFDRAGPGELRPVWGYGDQAVHVADQATKPIEEVLDAGVWEFQTGPAILGEVVLVQARQWTSEGSRAAIVDEGHVRAWCLALELSTGAVRWKRLLAGGAVLEGTASQRSVEARGAATPAAPLAVHDGRVFAATDLGIGSLLDAADGELLWSLRTSRRAGESPRRAPHLAPMIVRSCSAKPIEPLTWLWAPSDSSAVYRLRDGADRDGRGILSRAPWRIGSADEILGGDACCIVGWDPSPLQRSLWTEDSETGARSNSISIGREESAPAQVLVSPARVFFATDRALYGCDRTNDLALVDRAPLVNAARRIEPAMLARGNRIYVADSSALWVFDAE